MEEAQQLLSKQGHAASLQNMIERGEAATMEEAQALAAQNLRAAYDAKYSKEEQREIGKKALAASLQSMIDRGEAATMEEAQQLLSKQGNLAPLQNANRPRRGGDNGGGGKAHRRSISSGNAAEDDRPWRGGDNGGAQQLLSKQGHAASLQKIIDRGEAATMAEAQALAAQNMRAAIDAKYSKEEQRELSKKARAASLQNMIDRGEAATMEEAPAAAEQAGTRCLAAEHDRPRRGGDDGGGAAAAQQAGTRGRCGQPSAR